MVFGYTRVSTPGQNIERQVRNIQRVASDATILKEIDTGTKKDGRKEWAKLLKMLRSGDTVYFDSISRMSRNADVFLKGHSGDTIRVERIGRASERIDRPALTMLLAVQPEVLKGGAIWSIVLNIHGALQAIGYPQLFAINLRKYGFYSNNSKSYS